jgi:hypothetical protein
MAAQWSTTSPAYRRASSTGCCCQQATAPHDDDADCGFHGGAVPHLEPVNVEQAKLAEA